MELFLNYHHTYSNYASIILLHSEIRSDFSKNGLGIFFSTYWSCLWQISLELMEVKLARHWDLKNASPTCWDNGIYTENIHRPVKTKISEIYPIEKSNSLLTVFSPCQWRYNCDLWSSWMYQGERNILFNNSGPYWLGKVLQIKHGDQADQRQVLC